jgi:hypothetical protein
MARPLKHGLDYFPLNVDFFEDDKIQFVSSRFDEKGELIAVKLLCKIFKAGYFIEWNDDAALLFSKGAGRNVTPSLANDVVNELIRRGFFHKGLFERFSVLTSNGIQKRYIKICTDAKRKDWKIEEKYCVEQFTLEETHKTPSETSQTLEESTERKVKENKVKKSKVDAGAAAPALPKKNFKLLTESEFYDELKTFINSYSKEMLREFFDYWREKSPGEKMKFQLERTWETNLRLEKWKRNQKNFKLNGTHRQTPQKPVATNVGKGGFGAL